MRKRSMPSLNDWNGESSLQMRVPLELLTLVLGEKLSTVMLKAKSIVGIMTASRRRVQT